MRVAIQTLGTRGGHQPYIAFARGLMAAGYEVQLAAPLQFGPLVGVPCGAGQGREFSRSLLHTGAVFPSWRSPGEFLAMMDTPRARR